MAPLCSSSFGPFCPHWSLRQGGRGWTERSDRKLGIAEGCFAHVPPARLEFRGFARPLAPTTATQLAWRGHPL